MRITSAAALMTHDPIHLALAIVWLALAIVWRVYGNQTNSLICVAVTNVWLVA